MKKNKLPAGWDERRVRRVIGHYESQTEDQAVAEDEAIYTDPDQAIMSVPKDLAPKVRELILKRRSAR